MRSSLRASFLRTRFGRRMLLLFLACAMLPLAALTAIVLRQASDESERQLRANLRRTAKAVGMSLVAELNALTEFSDRIAHAAAAPDARVAREMFTQNDAEQLSAVVVLEESGDTAYAWRPDIVRSLTQPVAARADTRMLFRIQAGGGHLVAVTSAHTVGTRTMRVVVLLEPSRFFGASDVQSWRDAGTQSCALLERTPLWCSLPRGLWSRIHGMQDDVLSIDATRYAAATWNGFAPLVEPGTRLEVLAFSEPQTALGSANFRRSVILLVLVSLVLVFLVSHVQLRRSLRPLEELTEATRRVGAHNLDVRVDVHLDDEFGMLARSFNEMSGRLASHVALLSSTAAINDEALRAANVHELLPRLTSQVRTLLPTEYGLSFCVRLEQTRWLRRSVMTRATDWVEDELELGGGSLASLSRGDLVAGHFGARDSQPFMRAPLGQSGWHGRAVAIPLRAENELAGILTILVPDGMLATNAILENVRALASELALALNRTRLVSRLEQFNYGTLTALARTVDAKSPWTAGHSESVTYASMQLGQQLRLTPDELDLLHRGGLLHDIGKIAVPGAILDKPGRLTPEEMAVVQSHPEVGARILAPIDAYAPIIPIVLYHHERFDGSGYPHGLRGNAIPSLARLVAVADVYDALVSDRPYREGWAPERAAALIQESAGTHFDPIMADAFAAVEPRLRQWYIERHEQDHERRMALSAAEPTPV